MATALDIITDAFIRIGVYAPSETIKDSDAERALTMLTDMMDSWSNDGLACLANQEQSFVLVPGVAAYTIGVGGTVNTNRPLKIRTGPGAAYIQDSYGNNYFVDVVEQDTWNQIGLRTSTSNLPDTMFFDPQYPLGIINIFPVPTINYTVFFDSRLPFVDLANLAAVLALPPGWKSALQLNLAVEMWPAWKPDGMEVSQTLDRAANRAFAAVKRSNARPALAVYDAELVTRASSTYNIYRGR